VTVAVIALFMSFAVCALIGWAFIRVLEAIAKRVRGRSTPAAHRATDQTIVDVTLEEMVEGNGLATAPLPRRDVETYFENGRWKNKVQGNSRASNVHESWAAAIKTGREMARKRRVEHIIKKRTETAPSGDAALATTLGPSEAELPASEPILGMLPSPVDVLDDEVDVSASKH